MNNPRKASFSIPDLTNTRLDHGRATAKRDIPPHIKKDAHGLLTAYLPEDETFAVWFGKGEWYTFYDTEEKFLEMFEVDRTETADE